MNNVQRKTGRQQRNKTRRKSKKKTHFVFFFWISKHLQLAETQGGNTVVIWLCILGFYCLFFWPMQNVSTSAKMKGEKETICNILALLCALTAQSFFFWNKKRKKKLRLKRLSVPINPLTQAKKDPFSHTGTHTHPGTHTHTLINSPQCETWSTSYFKLSPWEKCVRNAIRWRGSASQTTMAATLMNSAERDEKKICPRGRYNVCALAWTKAGYQKAHVVWFGRHPHAYIRKRDLEAWKNWFFFLLCFGFKDKCILSYKNKCWLLITTAVCAC